MKIIPNPDEDIFKSVTEKVILKGGYCPCAIIENADTLCPCKEFRTQTTEGKCHCGRYIKVKDNDN